MEEDTNPATAFALICTKRASWCCSRLKLKSNEYCLHLQLFNQRVWI